MKAVIYKWIIVYEGGYTEEKHGTCPYDFADDIVDVPVAIIREGLQGGNESSNCKSLKPVTIKRELEDSFGLYGGKCPICGNWIHDKYRYCNSCGQEVEFK